MKSITIPFDKVKLLISTILFLSIFMAMPFICLYITLDPLLIFFLLTICWFTLKAGLRSIKRLIRKKPICSCDDTTIQINSLSDKTYVMKWNDIEKVVMKEKRQSIQFILFGKHIEHSSGVYMIHIHYPFQTKKLDGVTSQLLDCFSTHNITVETVTNYKKEIRINV